MGNSDIAQAIKDCLVSPNVDDMNFEPANVVDAIADLSRSATRIASAILPPGVSAGRDDLGGVVHSLTESMMSVTSGLVAISRAIDNLADAVRESNRA